MFIAILAAPSRCDHDVEAVCIRHGGVRVAVTAIVRKQVRPDWRPTGKRQRHVGRGQDLVGRSLGAVSTRPS